MFEKSTITFLQICCEHIKNIIISIIEPDKDFCLNAMITKILPEWSGLIRVPLAWVG